MDIPRPPRWLTAAVGEKTAERGLTLLQLTFTYCLGLPYLHDVLQSYILYLHDVLHSYSLYFHGVLVSYIYMMFYNLTSYIYMMSYTLTAYIDMMSWSYGI